MAKEDIIHDASVPGATVKLIVDDGSYEAPTLFRLVVLVLRHRFWHLIHDGKWED